MRSRHRWHRGAALFLTLSALAACEQEIAGPASAEFAGPAALDLPGDAGWTYLADPRPSPKTITDGGGTILDAVQLTFTAAAEVYEDGGVDHTYRTSVRMTGGRGNDYALPAKLDAAWSTKKSLQRDGNFLVVIAVPVDESTARALRKEGGAATIDVSLELLAGSKVLDRVEATAIWDVTDL